VMMASRSLIQLYRTANPELLHKKDRGRPTEATAELLESGKKYGEFSAKDFIPGAETLQATEENEKSDDEDKGNDDDDEGWEDVIHSSDYDDDSDEEEEEEGDDDDEGAVADDDGGEKAKEKKEFLTLDEKKAKAKEVTMARILSDADFKKIDAAQLKKQVQAFRKGGKKAKRRSAALQEEDEETINMGREELVDLANIEMVHKKRRHDKEARLASVKEGREDREKFGSRKRKMNEHASTTNKQKLKTKNFMMVKGKFKHKAKKSFVQKQKDLKQSMMRSRKFK